MRDSVARHAERAPEKPALIIGERVVSFGELDASGSAMARALLHAGVVPGEWVGLMLPNGVEVLAAHVALRRLGSPNVPINWHLKAPEIEWILSDSSVRFLIAHQSFAAQLRPALERVPGCTVVWMGAEPGDEPATGVAYGDLVGAVRDVPLPDPPEYAPPPIPYTSGTTGRPKAVVRTAAGVARSNNSDTWDLRPDDVHLAAAPIYHGAPRKYALASLDVGATIVMLPRWDAGAWLDAVDRHRVTTTFAVPTHFARLLRLPDDEWERADLTSLRLVIHAGAPCPVPLKRAIMGRLPHAEVWEYYGSTETGSVSRISGEDWLLHPGSVGRPDPGVEIRILDDDGTPLPPGHVGAIYKVQPPEATWEYLGDPEKTRAAWRDGACTAGDVGWVDEEGYLYLSDRGDMVLRGGVNVYPREIEDALFAHPGVKDCVVVGLPDEQDGARLCAVVEIASEVTGDELRAHCEQRLAGFKVPGSFLAVDAIERGSTGKVRVHLLRDAILERTLDARVL